MILYRQVLKKTRLRVRVSWNWLNLDFKDRSYTCRFSH